VRRGNGLSLAGFTSVVGLPYAKNLTSKKVHDQQQNKVIFSVI